MPSSEAPITAKICESCTKAVGNPVVLPISEFYADSSTASGYSSRCKNCLRRANREVYARKHSLYRLALVHECTDIPPDQLAAALNILPKELSRLQATTNDSSILGKVRLKQCANPFCARIRPANTDHFYPDVTRRHGLDNWCIRCRKVTRILQRVRESEVTEIATTIIDKGPLSAEELKALEPVKGAAELGFDENGMPF